jgi:sigma-E factor negative regulatory protein RseA
MSPPQAADPLRAEPPSPEAERTRAWLSALADGQADAAEPACRAFGQSDDAKATWHRYQLIGDVLRSADLVPSGVGAAEHDAAFLSRLRQRLAAEPAVLAPKPLEPVAVPVADDSRRSVALAARGHPRWLVPMAAAAGVAVVAGLVVLGGVGRTGPASPVLATADPAGGTLLRSAELDEYLRAHRLQRGAVVPMLPGGGLQQTELTAEPAAVPPPAADGRR